MLFYPLYAGVSATNKATNVNVNGATAGKGAGAGGGSVQKRSPENVTRTLVEDQRAALKFPHRLLVRLRTHTQRGFRGNNH